MKIGCIIQLIAAAQIWLWFWLSESTLEDLLEVLSEALVIFAVLTKPLSLGNTSPPILERERNVERQNLLTKAKRLAQGLHHSSPALQRKQLCTPRVGV